MGLKPDARDWRMTELLEAVRQQSYPLVLSKEDSQALVKCMRRIMDAVPEDEHVFVRCDYDLATSALCHPDAPFGQNYNVRVT